MNKITAEAIQASVGPNGIPIFTGRFTYPRWIHAESKTHRMITIDTDTWHIQEDVSLMSDPMLSRNAASSRAIPISKMLEQVRNHPATPIHWGKNQAGMQAKAELEGDDRQAAEDWWIRGAAMMAEHVESCPVPLHKQVANRVLEPWMMMTVIVTGTEWENFFWLRDHPDAQPEIEVLAKAWKKAKAEAPLFELKAGELHVPFVARQRSNNDGSLLYFVPDKDGNQIQLSPQQALKVSASCSAQTSFRALDFSVPKAEGIYNKLVESKPVHASPFEHQAIALNESDDAIIYTHSQRAPTLRFPPGITHIDSRLNLWSGNLRGWAQHRQLINGHHVPG